MGLKGGGMDLSLSDEQEMLRTSAREMLLRECPPFHVRPMEDDPLGYAPALWRKMGDLG